MKLLRQFGIILSISLIGELVSKLLNIPIPGNVIGMLILLSLLFLGTVKLETIDEITKFLLDHLAFFFIPAGVGLISNLQLLRGKWGAIFLICLISTTLVMVVTGLTIQLVKRGLKP
ncbi:MAG: holin-like protein [Clostridiales bacterium]|nr:holin-like protein [Clostridiales bacterium]MDK2934910.1 holin-like protein [Clostridiales bacterium]